MKEITVIASDSAEISDGHGDVVYYSTSGSDGDNGNADRSRYVIAKDGMVVTIEGSDEAKTKALAKEIEDKLGVNSAEKKEVKSK